MNTPYDMPQAPASANKPLWAAVAVLGVAVLAMGATLIRIQSRQAEPSLAVVPAASAPAQAASSAALAASGSDACRLAEPAISKRVARTDGRERGIRVIVGSLRRNNPG